MWLSLLVLNLFILLGSSSSISMDESSFGCVVILSLYFTLNFVISSLLVGTFKSACMTFCLPLNFFYSSTLSMFLVTKKPLSFNLISEKSGMKLGKYLCRNQDNFKPARMYDWRIYQKESYHYVMPLNTMVGRVRPSITQLELSNRWIY